MGIKERSGRKQEGPELPWDVFELDRNMLDKHCIEQTKLVMKYGQEKADAQEAVERSKAAADLARAEAADDITRNPDKHELVKATVDAVKAAVDRHEDVQMSLERKIRRNHDLDVLQAMMVALEHRKRMIEALIQLHGQQYYSSPSVTQEQQEALAEQTKKAVRTVRRRSEDSE